MQRRPEYAWRPWRSELQRSRSLCLAVNAAWRAEYPREPSFAGLILRRRAKLFMTAGQVSDDTGAAALPNSLPAAEWMLADRGHDADWFRDALQDEGIRPCIPGRKSRGKAVRYDKRRYRRRNRIEIMFGRLKDWRRVATRYDRCARPSSPPWPSPQLSSSAFDDQ